MSTGLAKGLYDSPLGGAGRWLVEIACVIAGGGSVIAVKRKLLHRRRAAQQ